MVCAGEKILFPQAREKFLCQILRVVRRISDTANVGVKRMPVGLAQPRQRVARPLRVVAPGGHDDRPVGDDKRGHADHALGGSRLRVNFSVSPVVFTAVQV